MLVSNQRFGASLPISTKNACSVKHKRRYCGGRKANSSGEPLSTINVNNDRIFPLNNVITPKHLYTDPKCVFFLKSKQQSQAAEHQSSYAFCTCLSHFNITQSDKQNLTALAQLFSFSHAHYPVYERSTRFYLTLYLKIQSMFIF